MKNSNYQLLCTVLMGVASLFRYIGYNISTFIIESLLHSAHLREPGVIFQHAGYYGQAVKELSTCLSTLIVPIVLNFVSPKWTLVIGSFMIAVYFASFFLLSNALYFTANIWLGISAALIYTSFYTCQMTFSTRETLARNSACIQGIASLSLISGGLLYMYITSIHENVSGTNGTDVWYRYYSEDETRTMWIFLFTFCIINLVLTCCLPTRKVENNVASDHIQVDAIRQQRITVATLFDPKILLLVPRFMNDGLLVSFFMNVYPTSLQYSTLISKPYPMITAYYSFAMCAGSTLCGLAVAPLNRYFADFGLRSLYYIATVAQFIVYALAVMTVPNWSTARPTADSALLEPQLLWVCVIAFLLGVADSANGASGVVGISAMTIFFCSSILTMRAHAVILSSATLTSLVTFGYAVKNIEKQEQKPVPSTKIFK